MTDLAGLLPSVSSLVGPALVVGVAALVFAESGILAGFLLPGDTVLFAAGYLAHAPRTHVNPVLLAVVATVAAVVGDSVGYLVGRRLGRPWLLRRYPARIRRVERLLDRWGWWAVVSARFIPWIRTFTPSVAGAGAFTYRRFLIANVVGALCWAAGTVAAGWFAATNATVRDVALGIAATAVASSAVAGATLALTRSRRRGSHSPSSSLP